jgi:REP element-mobilizing transposase RayT
MPHTLARNLVHCVFSTKGRTQTIRDPELLGSRFALIAKSKSIPLLTAGGTRNHVHLLLALPTTMTLSKAVQDLKAHASRWMKEQVPLSRGRKDTGHLASANLSGESYMNTLALRKSTIRNGRLNRSF